MAAGDLFEVVDGVHVRSVRDQDLPLANLADMIEVPCDHRRGPSLQNFVK